MRGAQDRWIKVAAPADGKFSARQLGLLVAIALAVNFGGAFAIRGPGYLDDAYYFGGALRLAQGQGFTEPYVWNYLGGPKSLPQPSHLYWMPLTSIVGAASMAVLGPSFAAARMPLVVLASALPLIAYAVALHASGLRRHALGAGLLAVFSGFYAPYWGTTDAFALYGVVGSLTLVALYKAIESGRWGWWVASGLGAGLAHLTRADGVLLLGIAGLAALTWSRPAGGRPRPFPRPGGLALITLGYLVVMLPWFLRNAAVAGSPLGGGGAGTLWLTDYDDLFNYPSNVSAARYLSSGWAAIARGKLAALAANAQTIVAVQGMVFLAPFVAIGLWQLRARTLFRLAILYAAVLYAVMTFAFSFPGARGGLFHSGTALLPFYLPAALVGVDRAVNWASRRLKHWQPARAGPAFAAIAVGLAGVLTAALMVSKLKGWNAGQELYRTVGKTIPDRAVVMSNNPPGLWVASGLPGVMVPNGDVTTLLAAADQFGAHYVLLDHNHPAGLAALYATETGERLTPVSVHGEFKLFRVHR